MVEGITENILSINRALDDGASVLFSPDDCHIKWPDGSKAQLERRGRQFILPYREKANPHGQARSAPVGDDPEAEAVEAYAALELPSDEEPEAMALEAEPAGEEPAGRRPRGGCAGERTAQCGRPRRACSAHRRRAISASADTPPAMV